MGRYYRFQNHQVSIGSEEFGFSSRTDVSLLEFDVRKETPKGVWLDYYGTKRFVLHDSRKKFAHPTIELAKASFIARKNRQIKILTKQLAQAQTALAEVEEVALVHREFEYLGSAAERKLRG